MRTLVFKVRIDGRTFAFYSGVEALDFLVTAARSITQKPWESELPDIGIVLDIKEPEKPVPEEELEEEIHCDEQLEKECEA